MTSPFRYVTFDVTRTLPNGWQQEILTAAADADFRNFPRTPILSREAAEVRHVSRGRVHADQVQSDLPWLYQYYRGFFLELAGEAFAELDGLAREEKVSPAHDERYGVVLNVQRGTGMRFESHIDSNPLTGLLFCTDHVNGGELVFAHDAAAASVEDVERACTIVRPSAGQLVFFSARQHPHYARPLIEPADVRVAAVMNYYTESYPESTRPPELNRHLYGDK